MRRVYVALISATSIEAPHDPWAFGWESIVGLGTLLLALATVWMALGTRRLARLTSREVAAQWRPVLVPGHEEPVMDVTPKYEGDESRVFNFSLRNTGTGPALDVHLFAKWYGVPRAPEFAAIAPGEQVNARLDVYSEPKWDEWTIQIQYRDIAGVYLGTTLKPTQWPKLGFGETEVLDRSPWPVAPEPWRPARDNYLMWRKTVPERLRNAANVMWPRPGAPRTPFPSRLRAAMGELRQVPRRQMFVQRVRHAWSMFRLSRHGARGYDKPVLIRKLIQFPYRVRRAIHEFRKQR